MARNASSFKHLVGCALLLPGPLFAATLCEPGLPTSGADPLAYRQRDSRCEGRYIREVAGSPLVVASFSEPLPAIGGAPGGAVELRWPAPPATTAPLRLQAQSLKRRVYYRMDTVRPTEPPLYRWERDVSAALVPAAGDVGLIASTASPGRELLLPVRSGTVVSSRYELVLIPGTEWRELRFRLSRAAEGQPPPPLVDKPLGYGYYPAERPVVIAIDKPLLGGPGVFRIDLEAQLDGGGAVLRTLWFLHAEGW